MPLAYGWSAVDLVAGLLLDQRQAVGRVAVDLVGRAEDERRLGRVLAGVLQHVEGADGVDVEVGERLLGGPVVRGLARRCGSPGRCRRRTA